MLPSEYKPVSHLAVAAFMASTIGAGSFIFVPLVIVAAISVLIAIIALRAIQKYALSGGKFAVTAIAMAIGSIVLSPMWHLHLYHSETLPGHARIELNTTETSELDAYNGKSVCLKGYALYLGGDRETDTFLLSPDDNYRKPEAAITVIVPNLWRYQYDAVAVSGILHVNPDATDSVHRYTLSAIKVHTANTSHLLVPRMPGDC